jgi:hypothetical protein
MDIEGDEKVAEHLMTSVTRQAVGWKRTAEPSPFSRTAANSEMTSGASVALATRPFPRFPNQRTRFSANSFSVGGPDGVTTRFQFCKGTTMRHKTRHTTLPRTRTTHVGEEEAKYLIQQGHQPVREYVDTSDGDKVFIFEDSKRTSRDHEQYLEERYKDVESEPANDEAEPVPAEGFTASGFTTSDPNLSEYLHSRGHVMSGFQEAQGRTSFQFPPASALKRDVENFQNGGRPTPDVISTPEQLNELLKKIPSSMMKQQRFGTPEDLREFLACRGHEPVDSREQHGRKVFFYRGTPEYRRDLDLFRQLGGRATTCHPYTKI